MKLNWISKITIHCGQGLVINYQIMTVTYQNYLKEPDSCKPVEHFIFSLSSVFYFILFSLALYCTLMCILALFSKLSVVCLVLSGPKGTSFFSCSRYSRSLARLQTHKHRASQQTSTSSRVTQAAPTQTVCFGLSYALPLTARQFHWLDTFKACRRLCKPLQDPSEWLHRHPSAI